MECLIDLGMARRTKEQARETRQRIIDAARGVFHRCGVSRASLEMVAAAAGLTRGAINWHFRSKAKLFLAVRENVLLPALDEVERNIEADRYADPLDAIEVALTRLVEILGSNDTVREVLETVVRRCESVDEFADVHLELERATARCLAKLEAAYGRALALGALRSGLDPRPLARDTTAFAHGLMYRALAANKDGDLSRNTRSMISFHMSLRRVARGEPSEEINSVRTRYDRTTC